MFLDITFETPIEKRWEMTWNPVWSFAFFFLTELTGPRRSDKTSLAGLVHYLALGLDLHGAPGHLVWNLFKFLWFPTKRPRISNSPMEFGVFFYKKCSLGWSKKAPFKKGHEPREIMSIQKLKRLGDVLAFFLLSKSWTKAAVGFFS